jgi:hypothetical protein
VHNDYTCSVSEIAPVFSTFLAWFESNLMEDLHVKPLIICEFREGVWSEGLNSRTGVNEIVPDFLNFSQFL